jgi:DNA-binding NarL/FixJ family response regulator
MTLGILDRRRAVDHRHLLARRLREGNLGLDANESLDRATDALRTLTTVLAQLSCSADEDPEAEHLARGLRRFGLVAQDVANEAVALAFQVEKGNGRHDRYSSELTRRQREVARLIAEGLTNREIANRLVISTRTADSHVEAVFKKLGVTNRAQVAVWYTRQTNGPPEELAAA